MQVTISTSGPFHLFETARQLESRGVLSTVYTGYPKLKLKQWGVSPRHIKTFPYLFAPWMLLNRVNISNRVYLAASECLLRVAHDLYCARTIPKCDVFIGLSSFSLWSGSKVKQNYGAIYVCERGSTHVEHQESVLRAEYKMLGLEYLGQPKYVISRELAEYDAADYICVPSSVARDSFETNGISREKIVQIPYGINTKYFYPRVCKNEEQTQIIFVGQLSIRKGLHKLIEAARLLCNENIIFKVVGRGTSDTEFLRSRVDSGNIQFMGHLNWEQLALELSRSHMLVLPSIEEGLAIVQGQALACGCPVVASNATGGSDLFANGVEGIVLDECTPESISATIQELMRKPEKLDRMSRNAVKLGQRLGGWSEYGDRLFKFLQRINPGSS